MPTILLLKQLLTIRTFLAGKAPNILFVLLTVFCCSHPALARQQDDGIVDDPVVQELSGARLKVDSVIYTALPAGVEPGRIVNIISLRLREETSLYIRNNFTATVKVKIEYGPNASDLHTITEQVLTVSYNKEQRSKYNAENYFHFTGAKYVRVTVLEITPSTVGAINIGDLLRLENSLQATRYYTLGNNVAPDYFTPVALGGGDDEQEVKWAWPSGAGNTHTQLEWTWLENEMESYYHVNGSLNIEKLFKNNSTRIDLPYNTNSYRIPLLYGDSGKLYCRIRAVNIKKNGSRSDGPWSNVLSPSFGGHHSNLNWQSTISFAEEGKRKAVVQYYDGSLRSRQTVTKDNVTNTTITAETFYDGEGRPAVQVLPVPGIVNKIGYTTNLNLFGRHDSLRLNSPQPINTDPAAYFDLRPLDTLTNQTPPLQTTSGAALYYSASNPQKDTGVNKYIPDAEGYPYAVTRYTPDATGRIQSQSGVGAAMRMGKGHETKYYYGTAAQEELDGLFGTDAGNFTHYFKNMVQDANGQMSVSYTDMHGRTIATALAGDAPANTVALVRNATHYPGQAGDSITRNLLNSSTNLVKNNSIEAINTLLVTVRTRHTFTYKLDTSKLSLTSCEGQALCYDCMYDLEISYTEESGDFPPIVRRYNNINLNADDNCTTGVQGLKTSIGALIANNTIIDTITLSAGAWTVRKTLTISEASLALQKEAWLQLNKGLCKTEQQLIDSIKTVLETLTGCNEPPAPVICESCLTSQNLPTRRQLMLADMMPYGGQYAQDKQEVPNADNNTSFQQYNIFAGSGAGRPFFRNLIAGQQPQPLYYNSLGLRDPVNDVLGTITEIDFVSAFQYSWAEALLPRHPEYGKLLFAEAHLTASYNYCNTLLNTETWADAMTNGYIRLTGSASPLPLNDPFYIEAPGYKPAMETMVNDNYRSKDGISLSMWQIAYGDVRCKTIVDIDQRIACYGNNATRQPATTMPYPFDNLTTAEKDQVWTSFRNLYSNERERQINDYINTSAPLTNAGQLVTDGYKLHFPTEAQLVAQSNTNGDWNWWPATPGGPPNVPANQGNAPITQSYASRCDSYINNWKQALLLCPQLEAHTSRDAIIAEITAKMAAVCKKGSDAANPYGSSEVAPGIPFDGSPRNFEEVINGVFLAYGINKSTLCNPYIIEFPRPYGMGPKFTPELITVLDTCNCTRFTQLKNAAAAAQYNPAVFSSLNAYFKATYNDTITLALYNAFSSCSLLGVQQVCHTEYDTVYASCDATDPCGSSLAARVIECGPNQHWSNVLEQCLENGVSYDCPLGYHWDNSIGDCVQDQVPQECPFACPVSVCIEVPNYSIALPTPQPWPDFMKCHFTPAPKCLTCSGLSSLTIAFKDTFNAPFDLAPVMDTVLTPQQVSYNVLYQRFLNYRTGFQYTWLDYARAAADANCNLANIATNSDSTQTVICADNKPLNDTTGIFLRNPPCQQVYNMAVALGQQIYEKRIQTLLADFDAAYRAKCLAAKDIEEFTVRYATSEYHYTLYYYDIAGNLVRTVAPKGARPDFSASFLLQVKNARASGGEKTPDHLMMTDYRYNGLNQVTTQNSPDGGTSEFWYDRLGRLAVSRNAKQLVEGGKYSYTLYDKLGRIAEVGQKPHTTDMDQVISQDTTALKSWILNSGGVREQITYTVYDEPYVFQDNTFLVHRNLRNRVSFTATQKLATDGGNYAASYYTYDVHGNVDTLLQDYEGIPEMAAQGIDKRFRKIAYNYDLISGKVNMVSYQPDEEDAFYHRYKYDAENKLVEVETSRDKVRWQRDAAYQYYKHGPLSRTELGAQRVQGMDYAYTIQGWLKGVNTTNTGNAGFDMGRDGLIPAVGVNTNLPVARDILGFALHYFDAVENGNTWMDYKPIYGTSPFARPAAASGFVSLYNGNIGAISINNIGLGKGNAATTNAQPLFYRYRYDQLNRIVSMQAYKGLDPGANAWVPVSLNDYKEAVSYDPNGNILGYARNGMPATGKPTVMDSLSYKYYAGTNRLEYVVDSVPVSRYTEDLDKQSQGNYRYDAIGNLIADDSAGITQIVWNLYGKIDTIKKGSNHIIYGYDASGNRIAKTVSGKTTIYVRDASGNVMSIYEKPATTPLKQIEVHLYGSSRLGMTTALTTATDTIDLESGYAPALLSTFTRGEKLFEMTNHLGNVLATLTDRKLQHSTDSTNRDYFEPDILTATDYYPFGMVMPGRGVALSATGCHEEWQDAVEVKVTSDLNSGAVQNGFDVDHNGVKWARMTTTSTITLENQAIKMTNGGGSSDGVIATVPIAQVEPNTTYVMEFDITGKSSNIANFNCQVLSSGNDQYRATTRKTGLGHHAILVTTPAAAITYLRLRISANVTTAGTYFVVDNFVMKKFSAGAVEQTTSYTTDFNAAVMSGVNVNDNGQLWTPFNSSITSLGVEGSTDRRIKVSCTDVNSSRIKTTRALAGGYNYTLRFTLAQDSADKRMFLNVSGRIGGTWTNTLYQGLFYFGTGNNLLNMEWPTGTDSIRVEFMRFSTLASYDGLTTPYYIDNFSITRLDTFSKRKVTVCDPPPASEVQEGLYRYGFNGQEKSTEIDPNGNSMTAEFWQYDARIGRRWNLDPRPTVGISPYAAFNNSPIVFSDPLGDTSVVGAGGSESIEIDEKVNSLEFYGPGTYYDAKDNWVPVKAGELRSFTNFLGRFAATWTADENGMVSLTGYKNEYGRTIDEAILSYRRRQALANINPARDFFNLATSLQRMSEEDPVGFVNTLMITHLTLNTPGTGGVVGGRVGPTWRTGDVVFETHILARFRGAYLPPLKLPLHQIEYSGVDIPIPNPEAMGYPHTNIGWIMSTTTGMQYRQTATFTMNSWPTVRGYQVPISRVDWYNHGTPQFHPWAPHQHSFSWGGTNWIIGEGIPFP